MILLKKLNAATWLIPTFLILVLSLWVVVERTISVFGFTLDDSFITYRYAQNWVNGHGLVWNIGENPPVEGFTTFLWVAVNAVFELFHLDPEWGSKIISLLALVGISALMGLTPPVVRQLSARFLPNTPLASAPSVSQTHPESWWEIHVGERGQNPPSRLAWGLTTAFVVGAYWVNPDLPAHLVSGMETMFSALLLLMFALSLAYTDRLHQSLARYINPHSSWIFLGLLALANGLIRPEFNLGVGVGFVACVVIQYFWVRDQATTRLVVKAFALYAGLGLMYYLWRYSYYGLPFPLPFYIKQLQPTGELLKGLSQMKLLYSQHQAFLWLALFGALLCPQRLIPPFLCGAAILGYFFFPDHIMGIYLRFVFPVLPIMFWLALNAFHRAVRFTSLPSPVWSFGLLFMATTLINGRIDSQDLAIKSQVNHWRYLPYYDSQWLRRKAWLDDYNQSEHRSLMPLGHAIAWARENAQGEPPIKVAMVDLGAAAYYGGWPMLDLFGLTHPKLALARARGEYSADNLLAEAPDIVLLGEFYREPLYRGQFPFESELYHRMPAYGYIPANRFIWNRVFGFLVFARDERIKERFNLALKNSAEISKTLQILPSDTSAGIPLYDR